MDSNMEIFALKDALWKLTARVAVIENVITEKFGAAAFAVVPKSSTSVSSIEQLLKIQTPSKTKCKRKSISSTPSCGKKKSLEAANEISNKRTSLRTSQPVQYFDKDVESDSDESESPITTQTTTLPIIKVEDEDFDPNDEDDEDGDEEESRDDAKKKAKIDNLPETNTITLSNFESHAENIKLRKPETDDEDYEYVLKKKKSGTGPPRGRYTGRKKDEIWLSFTKEENCDNSDVEWKCNTCHKLMRGNATRMKEHKSKCDLRKNVGLFANTTTPGNVQSDTQNSHGMSVVINNDEYEYVRRRKKSVAFERPGGRKKDDIWSSFSQVQNCVNPEVEWKCNTCGKLMRGNATRMKKHKEKCQLRQGITSNADNSLPTNTSTSVPADPTTPLPS